MEFIKFENLPFSDLNKHKNKWIIIPIGSIEPHGKHLPLSTDTLIAEKIAIEFCKKTNSILFPKIEWGVVDFILKDNTIFIRDSVFEGLLSDIIESLMRLGFTKILIINGHGTNIPIINRVAEKFAIENPKLKIIHFVWYKAISEFIRKNFEGPGHAGEDETSWILLINQNLVNLEKTKDNTPKLLKKGENNPIGRWIFNKKFILEMKKDFCIGKPSLASKDKGKLLLEKTLDVLMEVVESVG